MTQRSYPAHGFQGNGVNLVNVVDFGAGVVVLAIANDVDQVVVGEVRDGVAEVRKCSDDKRLYQFFDSDLRALTSTSIFFFFSYFFSPHYLEKMFWQGSG